MKANEVQIADGNLLMKKIKDSVGQSMQGRDEDRTEGRWYESVGGRKGEQTHRK